ncbi:MAG: argininosuccinate lyase [Deltaproteobacteria bacterium]|nr:argininosuccinate lyase [Deltaproteobacteria bacterium]
MATDKAWGGRFSAELDAGAARFLESVSFDKRLADEDLRGSLAHAEMLGSIGVLSPEEVRALTEGLSALRDTVRAGDFPWDPAREDVHMNLEAALGPAGQRLHTGRSRNDQVATDLRLWARGACASVGALVDRLALALVDRAEGEIDTLLPAYTHVQRAQPNRLAHHLLAWVEMLERDRGRLDDCSRRLNECPLGSGAVCATTFPLDRERTARALGFLRPTRNSVDATADRDFLVELLAALAITATHLSRLAEELVWWSTQEFGFVELADAHATGSSMMPQKKNPDVAEVVRAKVGRVVGDLVALLVVLKGLPLGYNRDLQEDKAPCFDAVDTVSASLAVLADTITHLRFDRPRMRAALGHGFVTATEVADWLVTRGVAFREAHGVAGRLVALCLARGVELSGLPLDAWREVHPAFTEDVFRALDPEVAVERRDVFGGPARRRVLEALADARARLDARRGPTP